MPSNYDKMPLYLLKAKWDKGRYPLEDKEKIKAALMQREKDDSFYPSLQYTKSLKISKKLLGHTESVFGSRWLQPYHFVTVALELGMFDTLFCVGDTYYLSLTTGGKKIGGVMYADIMLVEYNLKSKGDFLVHRALKIGKEYVYLHKLVRLSSQRDAKQLYKKLSLYKEIFTANSVLDDIYGLHKTYLGRVTSLNLSSKYLNQELKAKAVTKIAESLETDLTLAHWQNIVFSLYNTSELFHKAVFEHKNKALFEFTKNIFKKGKK